MVEEALPTGRKKFWEALWPDDLEVYVNLILADTFLNLDEPRQALLRLENIQNKEPSDYLKIWRHEYLVSSFAGDLDKNIIRGEFKEVISRYEPRKRDVFLNQVRPEVLWRVARAFEGLNLFYEADKVLSLAEKVQESIARTIPRPYDPAPEDWRQFRAAVNLGLYSLDSQKKDEALASLKLLNQDLVTTQRLWLKFGDISGNPKIRIEAWKKLEGIDPLTWVDVERYARAVEEIGDHDEYAKLLERTTGVWFGEFGKNSDQPAEKRVPPALLMRLADSRIKGNRNLKGALAVLDYLGTLDPTLLGAGVTKAMIAFKRGQSLKNLGRFDDARQSFVLGRVTDPDSVWGRLSSSAEKDLNSTK